MSFEQNGQTNSRDKAKTRSPYIFSLAPKANLESPDLDSSAFAVYKDYLTVAFHDPSVYNLAITGGYGIGKSSVIRSFDAHYSENKENGAKKKEFLYISLGSYEEAKGAGDDDADSGGSPQSGDADSEDAGDDGADGGGSPQSGDTDSEDIDSGEKSSGKEKAVSEKEMGAIERRLLLQIFVQFRREDIPLSGFQLIREPIAHPEIFARFITALVSMLCVLSFHELLGALLVEAAEKTSSLKILGAVLGWMVEYKTLIHFVLCSVSLVLFSLVVYHFCHFAISRLRFNGLSIKSENAEISWEKLDSEGCIDKYVMELVYCLEQIADKVKHTIVFEDMDRLPCEAALRIFMRLREINKLANSRLKSRNSRIRFVYIINNQLVSSLEYTKFFDFVLPIFPSLNYVTAPSIFRDNLKMVNQSIATGYPTCLRLSAYYELDKRKGTDGFVYQIAPFLSDYRRQYTILNEYGMALQMYCDHNKTLRKNDPLYMLAFSVYKNFWPNDYHTILDNQNGTFKSKVFPTRNLETLEREGFPHINLLKILSPYLTLESLSCAGFNQRILIDSIHQSWNQRIGAPAEIVKDIDSFAKENVICLKAVWDFCAASTDDLILAAAVRCAIHCEANREDKLWFFRNRTPLECCKILASDALKNLTAADKDTFCETTDKSSCLGLFAECKYISTFHTKPSSWTEGLMKEFSQRVKQLPDSYKADRTALLCGKSIGDWFSLSEDNP